MSNLPPLNITTKNNAKWNLKKPYFQYLVGTWIVTSVEMNMNVSIECW